MPLLEMYRLIANAFTLQSALQAGCLPFEATWKKYNTEVSINIVYQYKMWIKRHLFTEHTPRHEHYSVHLGDLKQLQPYLLRISQNLSIHFKVLRVDMQIHLVGEAKRLLAVDPPSASLDSSRTAVPASPSLLGWPPLAAAAADDALPPAHQDIFQHDTPGALQCALQSLTVLSE